MRIERGYRETGLATARDMLDDDARLLILGPAGAGRTTLLADLDAHEGRHHRRVWWCRGRAGDPGGEPALHRNPLETLLELAAREPTTLLVDDLDRLDTAVLERLLVLVERRAELGLRVAASQRQVPVSPALAALHVALVGRFGALHLGPLTADGVASWVVEQHGSSEGAAELAASSGGWPELVAAALSAPTAIGDLVSARVALLSHEQRTIVRAICFGLPVGTAVLAMAAGAEPGAIDTAVELATAIGLVHAGAEPAPAVADAVCAAATAADRQRIAAVLPSAPHDVLVAGAHRLLRVGDRSPEAGEAYSEPATCSSPRTPWPPLTSMPGPSGLGGPSATCVAGASPLSSPPDASKRPSSWPGETSWTASRAGDALLHRSAAAGWSHLGRPDLAAGCYLATDDPVLAVLPLLAAGRASEARAALDASPSPAESPERLFAAAHWRGSTGT